MAGLLLVRQLLAQHSNALSDIRLARAVLLQDHCRWSCSRSAFRRVWKNGARAHDRSHCYHEQACRSLWKNTHTGHRGDGGTCNGRGEVCCSTLQCCQDRVLISTRTPVRQIYESLDYSIADIEESAGASISVSSDKATVLMGRMRHPSLSLHGIEGAFSGVGAKTVIPAKVGGKFSVRFVHLSPLRLITLLMIWGKKDSCPLRHQKWSTHW